MASQDEVMKAQSFFFGKLCTFGYKNELKQHLMHLIRSHVQPMLLYE